jgi:RimJ/RimL family protein N-acetyltransferase
MLLKDCLLWDKVVTEEDYVTDHFSDSSSGCHCAPLEMHDIDDAIRLARKSVHPTPLPWVIETLEFHRNAAIAGLDDGRSFYKLEERGQIRGLCGLHRYIWGPPNVCWASWFIVDPIRRHTKAPGRLAMYLFRMARCQGFHKMYVETYQGESPYVEIERALPRLGFHLEAVLHDYIEPNVNSAIYVYDLRRPKDLL